MKLEYFHIKMACFFISTFNLYPTLSRLTYFKTFSRYEHRLKNK